MSHAPSITTPSSSTSAGLSPPALITPIFDEALARMQYLAKRGAACGLVLGPAGCGKSLLLTRFAAQQQRLGAAVARVAPSGMEAREFWLEIAIQWGCGISPQSETVTLARRACDRLSELAYEQTPAILLLDDAQLLGSASRQALQRLLGQPQPLLVIAACRENQLLQLPERLLEQAELRIELDSWSEEETASFLHQGKAASGSRSIEFTPPAITRLHDLAAGIPRQVEQLAELVRLISASSDSPTADETIVQAAYQELLPPR